MHDLLAEKLSDDLVISIALDEGEYYIAISVHKSKKYRLESETRNIQSCLIDPTEYDSDIDELVEKIVDVYKSVLVEKDDV